MTKIGNNGWMSKGVRVGAPDPSLTAAAGLIVVHELVERLGVIEHIDAAVGPIKDRARGFGAGQLLVGLAAAQLAGEDFLVGLDRQRNDTAGQALTPVPGLASTTAAGLARRLNLGQWRAVETGLAGAHAKMLALIPRRRAVALRASATIDLDATDVEVYGVKKRGVAYNYYGQRAARPHVASWAETGVVLAADLMPGNADPRPVAAEFVSRALAALPAGVRAARVRADAGYFSAEVARAAREHHAAFAIGAKRMPAVWRALDGIDEAAWAAAIDMPGAEVAVSPYTPVGWPPGTIMLIRRVAIDPAAVSADPRARRRRTIPKGQLQLALDGQTSLVHGYSFILTDLDCSTPTRAAAVEHWYRARTAIEDRFRDSKHGAALRHLPSGHHEVNLAWMWGALIATTIAGWLHELTAHHQRGKRHGWGIRGGKATIATLRRTIICVPARLITHAGQQILRPPPERRLLADVLTRLRALPRAA